MQASHSAYIEMAPFRARHGVSDDELLQAVDAMQSTLAGFEGFQRRETLKMEDGTWLDVVCWRDKAVLEAAMAQVTECPNCLAFFDLIEETGVPMHFGQRLRVQQAAA